MKYVTRQVKPDGKRSRPRGWPITRLVLGRGLDRRQQKQIEIIHFEDRGKPVVEIRYETGAALDVVKGRLVGRPAGTLVKLRTDHGVQAARAVAVEPKVDPAREAMVQWCWWAIENDTPIHYSQARPFPVYPPGTLPMTLDCSGSTITFARWAGAPNPSGAAPGYGNSASIAAFAKPVARENIEPGDICVFGSPVTHHVAVVLEPGLDPLMESHGQEAGPFAIRLSVESRYHAGDAVRFFSLTEGK